MGGGLGAGEGGGPGGAGGMMGVGDGDGLLALGRGERQAAQTVDSGLASIAGFDFDFDSAETQGQYERFDFEYLDDNYEFSVRYMGHELRETLLRIGVALGALLGLCVLYWILRVVGQSRTLSTLLATLLLFVSVAMVAVGVFPILGLLVLAAAVLWILKSWIPTGAAA